jgi:RNA polymerase sigma-70 factor (ECF subfamily)
VSVQRKLDYAALGDAELAQLCIARDQAAIRHVTTCTNQRLFRAAWSVLKDHSEAEEAVQAAYLKAFAGIAGFEGRSSLSTWLTRIVVNEALQRLRKARRQRASLEAEGVAVLDTYRENLMRGSEAPPPDATIAREQLRRILERAVASLPDAFRSVFVLREIEGLSVEETAAALDLAPATVKTRLLRARRKLQEALAPDVKTALVGAFPFAGVDCERMTERVLKALQYE